MRILAWIAGGVALLAAAFFAFAPGIAERSMNRVVGGPWPVSARAAALHKTLTIADMHADTLLWQRHLDDAADRGQVDLPRLGAGNVALQVFSSVTKTPKGQNYESNGADTDNITLLAIGQLQPVATWGSLLERSLWHAEKLRRAEAASGGRLRIVRSPADLDRLLADRAAGQAVTGAVLSVEGAQNLEGKAANLGVLYDAGFRMIGLAHFFDNELAGSMHGLKKGGLTPFGRQMVAEMERRGIVVDLAHCSHACFADVMRVATRPVVVSHGGVKATCNTNRNLSDDELRALAKNGGVIGIGYWDAAVCAPTPAATARAIAHAVAVAGIDHVGLGSDFDGSVTTGFDTAHLDAVTQALLDAGFGDADIARIMGGNVVRTLRAGMVPA
jgi:microsomal dipeptidase-like Zn-dependent dipeptidase